MSLLCIANGNTSNILYMTVFFLSLALSVPNATTVNLIKIPTCTSEPPPLGTLWHPKQKSQLVSQNTFSLQSTEKV